MNTQEINENKNVIHMDEYLDFTNKFSLDNKVEVWFLKSNTLREIDSLISKGNHYWFRLSKNWNNIQITPIYKDIDPETISKIKAYKYNNAVSLSNVWDALKTNESIYFNFDLSKEVTSVVDVTEQKVEEVL